MIQTTSPSLFDLEQFVNHPLLAQTFALRVARSREEKEAIFQLRYDIYVKELNRKQKAADHLKKCVQEPLDDSAILIGLFRDDEIIGTSRLNWSDVSNLPYPDLYEYNRFSVSPANRLAYVSKLMLKPEYRKTSLSTDLCCFMYLIGLHQGVQVSVIDCNDHLIDYFRHLGYREYKAKANHPEFGWVTPMFLDMYDKSWLIEMGSPFLTILERWHNQQH